MTITMASAQSAMRTQQTMATQSGSRRRRGRALPAVALARRPKIGPADDPDRDDEAQRDHLAQGERHALSAASSSRAGYADGRRGPSSTTQGQRDLLSFYAASSPSRSRSSPVGSPR